MEGRTPIHTEKRKGPDPVVKAVWWASGISWLLFIAALFLLEFASPEANTFFDRLFSVTRRQYWNEYILQYVPFILVLNLPVCILGFIFNLMRKKRKTDRVNKSILLLGIITLAGIFWYIFR